MARRKTAQERRLDALLRQFEPQVAKAFLEAVQAQRQAVDLAALIEALERRDIERAVQLLRMNQQALFPLTESLRGAVIAGGQTVAATLPLTIRGQFGFGGNPRAVRAVEQVTGKLAEILAEEATEMARQVIGLGIANGVPPRKQALDLVGRTTQGGAVRRGGFIGLDAPRAEQARKVRAMLTDPDEIARYFKGADPRYKTTDRRFDSMVRKAIAEGRALTPAQADRISELHKARLLRNRGETIARTETLNALRTGQHEGFGTLVDTGLAEGMTVKWLATSDSRTRDAHRELNGTIIAFGELFESPTGGRLAHPGDTAHGAGPDDLIQCRCVAVYRTKKPEF
ncbi:phage minor head protein [Oceaniglobus ichthyenteri]|uniref:phage minor head protein n=1 Tax=Oceaniglobus ichthyenteri TaxID=2136177 RepID=UPI000D39F5B1|nr:phage minor head protein [Oceaniglobus ichthyenteri]